jgi:hypothetical protein
MRRRPSWGRPAPLKLLVDVTAPTAASRRASAGTVRQIFSPGASPIWYGSLTTVAPAALSFANSPRTSAVSRFQMMRPGGSFFALT